MNNISKRDRLLLVVIIVLGVFYLYYTFFFTPIMENINTNKQSIEKNRGLVNNIDIVKTSNKKQEATIKELGTKYEAATKSLPGSEKNPEVYYEVKKIADGSKIIINNIAVGKGAEYKEPTPEVSNSTTANKTTTKQGADNKNQGGGKLMVIPVSLNITGSYTSVMDFIVAIENDKRIAETSTLNITQGKNNSFQGSVTLNYYYIELNQEEKYDFNTGTYGKENLFK